VTRVYTLSRINICECRKTLSGSNRGESRSATSTPLSGTSPVGGNGKNRSSRRKRSSNGGGNSSECVSPCAAAAGTAAAAAGAKGGVSTVTSPGGGPPGDETVDGITPEDDETDDEGILEADFCPAMKPLLRPEAFKLFDADRRGEFNHLHLHCQNIEAVVLNCGTQAKAVLCRWLQFQLHTTLRLLQFLCGGMPYITISHVLLLQSLKRH
jgi:hypothetical protein